MALPEHQDRGLFGLFDKKKEEEKKHEDETQNEAQTEAASYYPTPPQHGVEHCQGHGHEGQLTPEEAEQNKHAGLGLFGKKEHEEGKHEDENTDNEAQAEAASYYPTPPQHGVEHGHGHEGQLTPEEAEQQKHAGFLGKLHRTHSSSSSGDEEEEEEGRKKKDAKDKTKEKLPGDGQHSSCQCAGEEEKKAGPVDNIKEKLPGHPNKKEEEEEEVEKKAGLLDKIKEKLPGHPNKKEEENEEKLPGHPNKKEEEDEVEKKAGPEEEDEEKLPGHPNKKEEEDEVEKKAGLLDKIKEKLPGHHNKKEGEVEENP